LKALTQVVLWLDMAQMVRGEAGVELAEMEAAEERRNHQALTQAVRAQLLQVSNSLLFIHGRMN
jgi:hypothetical protein